jgi:hypothetical protein
MIKHPPGSEDIAASYKGLRKSVGAIGLLLPIALIIAGLTFLSGIKTSISHFFTHHFLAQFLSERCVRSACFWVHIAGMFLKKAKG